MFGLLEKDINLINEVFKKFNEIELIIIFGSRAIGNYKSGSDVDIALKGKNLNKEQIIKISGILNEEKPMPYYFDIIDYNSITNKDLKKHIDEEGKIFPYNK